VRNGKAENLANLVSELFTKRTTTTISPPSLAPGVRPGQIGTAPAPGAAPATGAAQPGAAQPAAASFAIPGTVTNVSSEVRVIADKDNNALLVLATPTDYEIIESALVKLDVIPRQVLVEVTIAEVTLSDDLKFGVDWFLTGRSVGEASVTSGALNLGGLPTTPAGAVPGFSGLQLINSLGGDVRAVLNALGKDGRLQVLATPQLMVLDNQKAQIKIGDRISVQTQQQTVSGTTNGLINSFQYIETGILLSVTPRINSGGQVTLEVSQEVSVPGAASVAGANPDISQRTATTTVVVGSGESIVLGGLIREDNTRSTSGIPLLSKIPILGAAFGTQSIVKRRTETILLIRPVVITNVRQAAEATEELRRKMPSLEGLLPAIPESRAPAGAGRP
jgi:general secretion pathway protein D